MATVGTAALSRARRRASTIVVTTQISVLLGHAALSVSEARVASDAASSAAVMINWCVSCVSTVMVAVESSAGESDAVVIEMARVARVAESRDSSVLASLREKATWMRVEYGGKGGGSEGGGGEGGGSGGSVGTRSTSNTSVPMP